MTATMSRWATWRTRVRQTLCGLRGHDALLHFEAGRMSLLCTSCDHETPGWDAQARPLPFTTSTRGVRWPWIRVGLDGIPSSALTKSRRLRA